MDGGTTWNINIPSAINGCLDQGFLLEQIVVDVVVCSTLDVDSDFDPGHTLKNFQRGRKIKKYYSGRDAIQTSLAAYPGVNWRYLIEEKDSVGGKGELDFDNDATWPLQMQGRELAKEVLAYGPGYGWDNFVW